MKPKVIEYSEDGHRCAILYDEIKAFSLLDRDTGRTKTHYPGAVDFGRCKGGVLHVDPESRLLLYPRPCLYVAYKDPDSNSLQWAGIDEKSAVAMLQLARSGASITADFATDEWEFSGPRSKGVNVGWGGWQWIAAWRWNWWQAKAMKGQARYDEMVAFGYPDKIEAFRKMLSRMKLVTSRKR